MGFTTWKTQTIGNGLVLPPKTRHFKFTILAPIKYLSSDCTMTWSVRTLSSFGRSLTSHCQICDQTNIRWVAIKNLQILLKIWCYFAGIQRILTWSQIEKREVEERVTLHNLHLYHVIIRWDLKFLIGAKIAGTVKWNRSPGSPQPKTAGNNPANTKRVRFWPGLEPNQTKLPFKSRTAGGLPRPVANTTCQPQDTLGCK